jgi:hypothetical protein
MPAMKRAWKWMMVLAAVAAPWLYGLSFPFVYDDVGLIEENAFLEDPSNVGRVLTAQTLADPGVVNGRRPVVLASYFLDRALYGLKPTGWRVTSLLLHLGCVGLFMWLLRRLGAASFFAGSAGLLYGLHPVLTEAVHAPGFRADLLCFFFLLAALHCFMGPSGRVGRQATGLACLALALLSKETALVMPLALAVLMGLFPEAFPPLRRRRSGAVALCAGLAGVFFCLWAVLPTALQAAGGGAWNGESLRFPENLFSIPSLWTHTLRLLVVPWPLNVTPAFVPVPGVFSVRFAVGLFWLGLCLFGAWRWRRSLPFLSLALAWMLIFFLPVSNLWPLLHPVAERYLYSIAPGFGLLAAWILAQQSIRSRVAGVTALGLLYAVLLMWRIWQWETPAKLWTAAYFQNANSATAATWLGLLQEQAGNSEEALAFYQAAVKSNPQAAAAWINAGILEGKRGNAAESEWLLRRAIEVQPENANAWRNLAVCLAGQARALEARAAAQKAVDLRRNP